MSPALPSRVDTRANSAVQDRMLVAAGTPCQCTTNKKRGTASPVSREQAESHCQLPNRMRCAFLSISQHQTGRVGCPRLASCRLVAPGNVILGDLCIRTVPGYIATARQPWHRICTWAGVPYFHSTHEGKGVAPTRRHAMASTQAELVTHSVSSGQYVLA